MKTRIYIFLFFLLTLAGLFRFWRLTEFPVSLSIDEVAVGYDAYSILKTGKDQFGDFLPLAFTSVGDYKSPVLIYLTTLPIALFGLNEFAVRFPVALFSTLTVMVVFFLIKELTKRVMIGLIAAFSVAISTWHVFPSRFSSDGVLALFFVLLGVLCFLRWVEGRGKRLWLAGLFFVISMYTYHAERFFVPLLSLGLFVAYKDKLLEDKKSLLRAIFISFFLLLPLIHLALGPEAQTRPKMIFLSKDENISFQLHAQDENLTLSQKIFDNNFIILANFWVKRYLNYYDPSFLFFEGMRFSWPKEPDAGVLYLFELPFFLIGLFLLLIKRDFFDKRARMLVIFWLAVGPLPASLTNNEQHVLRSLTLLPIPQLLVALGVVSVWNYLRKIKPYLKYTVAGGGLILLLGNIIYVADLYFVHYSRQFSEYWDYGLKEASLFAWEHETQYKEIVVDSAFGCLGPYTVGVPNLYILFYGKYDPATLQAEREAKEGNFGKFKIRKITWPDDRKMVDTMFIGSPWQIPLENVPADQLLKKIYFKNGCLGFLITKGMKED